MNILKILLLMLTTAMISIGLTTVFYSFYVIEGNIEKEMSLIIGENPGFDVGKEAITFGKITKEGSCRREIILSNKKNYPINIKVSTSGNISSFVFISDNDFILNPGEEKKLYFTAISHPEAEYGEYTGKASFILKRVL
jgi:hypothetical protein